MWFYCSSVNKLWKPKYIFMFCIYNDYLKKYWSSKWTHSLYIEEANEDYLICWCLLVSSGKLLRNWKWNHPPFYLSFIREYWLKVLRASPNYTILLKKSKKTFLFSRLKTILQPSGIRWNMIQLFFFLGTFSVPPWTLTVWGESYLKINSFNTERNIKTVFLVYIDAHIFKHFLE